MAVQPPLFGFMAVQPPHNTSLQCFLWLSSHHFFPPTPKKIPEITVFDTTLGVLPKQNSQRSQFLPISWRSLHQKIPEIPVFTTTLGVPPPKKSQRYQFLILPWGYFPNKIPRDPSLYHYLGGPSQKKIPEIPVFTTILGVPPPKKFQNLGGTSQTKFPEIPVFTTILVAPPKKNPRDPSFYHYLGGSLPQKNPRDPSF